MNQPLRNPRLRPDDTLVIATHNRGKVREIEAMLAPYRLKLVAAGDLRLPEPEETGTTFEANAELKALAAVGASGLPVLADDSGLAVDALGGAPGIYSARWAGPEADFARAMLTIEEKLRAKGATAPAQRRAQFVAAVCYAEPGGFAQMVRGEVAGTLTWPPRGANGFGYDPVFVPDGETLTFGELEPAKKDRMSHRARAIAAFAAKVLA